MGKFGVCMIGLLRNSLNLSLRAKRSNLLSKPNIDCFVVPLRSTPRNDTIETLICHCKVAQCDRSNLKNGCNKKIASSLRSSQ